VPFPAAPAAKSAASKSGNSDDAAADTAGIIAPHSSKWLTVVIIGLILAGVLLGAGAATYWISHFAPQLRHSASKQATFPPVAIVAIYLR